MSDTPVHADLRPWPSPWPPPPGRGKIALSAVGLALAGFLVVAGGIGSLDGAPVVLVLAGPALALAAGSWFVTVLRGRHPRRAGGITLGPVTWLGQTGTIMSYSAVLHVLHLLWPLVIAVWFLPLLLATMADLTQHVVAFDLGTGALLLLTGLPVLHAGWFTITLARAGFSPGLVALTPHGVYHHHRSTRSYTRWQDIVAVTATTTANTPAITLTTLPRPDPRAGHRALRRPRRHPERITIPAHWLRADPATAYHALTHYTNHPHHRKELATPAGIHRLRRRNHG